MAEKLGVVRGEDNPLGVPPGEALQEAHEVAGVLFRLGEGRLRVVGGLLREVGLAVGHPPVVEAGEGVLAVELPVKPLPRVAIVGAPHLEGGLRVAGEDPKARLQLVDVVGGLLALHGAQGGLPVRGEGLAPWTRWASTKV